VEDPPRPVVVGEGDRELESLVDVTGGETESPVAHGDHGEHEHADASRGGDDGEHAA
jgi:hypothetical protein